GGACPWGPTSSAHVGYLWQRVDGMSSLLWDEDNACWTESFVSPSGYDKSLSSHVSM
ncbi:hypothetical protein Tco_1169834, partial [Tanacetum coccineum]